ncbi:hypothetical protein LLEC1_04998 [Akanthomyces lecanii]|uniref:protein-ribulosamine 3-kinase n=1 Tax=Cordyceps confragosa TaxID=2714763 RepID=A0A179IAU3_CORDF|nr:hypothetical protein LLEC1_04998 [Akanthomyces lecanii]
MASAVDGAILEALGLNANDTTMSSHGGSGFASTFKLSTTVDGQPKHYFVKTGSGADAETMFKGEHASLNAIADAVPNFCPRAHAHGAMHSSNRYFLATDFLDLGVQQSSTTSSSKSGSGVSLAAKLAKLHTTPAPVPDGHRQPMFGFPVATCCGETAQDNTYKSSWVDFYANNRLRGILKASVNKNGTDAELAAAVETVVYDPSAVYGHAEYDHGIMNMFGGFGTAFWAEYHELVPKAEPRDEWTDRVALYELYHHLNHFAMFGGGYRGGAMSIMKRLISKYAG